MNRLLLDNIALRDRSPWCRLANQSLMNRSCHFLQWQSHFAAGYASYLALLNAEQTYQQARINLVQAQANRYADTAALFQALGGGWWNRADLTRN